MIVEPGMDHHFAPGMQLGWEVSRDEENSEGNLFTIHDPDFYTHHGRQQHGR